MRDATYSLLVSIQMTQFIDNRVEPANQRSLVRSQTHKKLWERTSAVSFAVSKQSSRKMHVTPL